MAQERPPSLVKNVVSPSLKYLAAASLIKGALDFIHFPTPFPSLDADILGGLALYNVSIQTSRNRPKEDDLSLGLLTATGFLLGGSLLTHVVGNSTISGNLLSIGEISAVATSVYKTVQMRHQSPQ